MATPGLESFTLEPAHGIVNLLCGACSSYCDGWSGNPDLATAVASAQRHECDR